MNSTALYALSGQYQSLVNRLTELDLDETTVLDTIDASGLVDEITIKAQSIEIVARTIEMHNPTIDSEIDRLQKLKKQRQSIAKGLRDYLLSNMISSGITKIDAPLFKLGIRNNPESVVIDAESQIPQDYMREIPASYSPDKALIKQAIKDGFEVPGAHLTRTQSLSIK